MILIIRRFIFIFVSTVVFLLMLTFLLLLSTTTTIRTVNANVFIGSQNYNPYYYDQTVQQFTPDGRLLQVEYATIAATQYSFPIIVLPTTMMMIGAESKSTKGGDRRNDGNVDNGHIIITARRKGTIQERLVVLRNNPHNTNGGGINNSGNNNDIVIALSGILADSLVLLRKVQSDIMNRRRTYGGASMSSGGDSGAISSSSSQIMSVSQIASVVSAACQLHSFGGGIRPFGCSLVICGLGVVASDEGTTTTTFLRTDPSGAIQDYTDICSSQDNDNSYKPSCVVIGGPSGGTSSGKRGMPPPASVLQRRLDNEWSNIQRRSKRLGDSITKVIQIVQQETNRLKRQQQQQRSSSKDKNKNNNNNKKDGNDDEDESNDAEDDDDDYVFEIVIISPLNGIYKLSDEQVEKISGTNNRSQNKRRRWY